VRIRRIPNVLAFSIAALALVRAIYDLDLMAAIYTIEASAAVFAATLVLVWGGMLGGGDAKLIAATALLVGNHDLVDVLFQMSVCEPSRSPSWPTMNSACSVGIAQSEPHDRAQQVESRRCRRLCLIPSRFAARRQLY
jgi:hypothetical protein